ncbi:hypothetical protein [Mesorhizobium sp. IMUNJ 23232]|uniref:hypothetical protein n=1 Tax=Mesorhizobium sp. IMUNJ 23232 TaxID=3376064 RepID=UPI0037A539AC
MTSSSVNSDQIQAVELKSASHFGPLLLQEALRKLCETHTTSCLDKFERQMVDRIDAMDGDDPDFSAMKEYAIQRLYNAVAEVRNHPESRKPNEDIQSRRTPGRSENPQTLEEQLQHGLEDSFPASDPPAVVSTAISGRSKPIVGVEEVLRRKRQAQTKSA